MGDLSKHFSTKEFTCPCGKCETIVTERLVGALEQMRLGLGVKIQISKGGGYRCKAYNRKIGGAARSAHITGEAADIIVPTEMFRFLLIERAVIWFHRIGVYDRHVHVDVSHKLPRPRCWVGVSK